MQRSWSSVGILADANVGGLVGHKASGATTCESYATGTVEQYGRGGVGGLAGINVGMVTER